MMRRRILARIARFLVAVLAFAQGALAFAGCEMPQRAPAAALAEQPCHEPAIEPNLCLAHCLAEDQSLDKPAMGVPAMPQAPVLAIPATFVSWALPLRLSRQSALPGGPPPRILFQSFLI
jgi:hypothetical protein